MPQSSENEGTIGRRFALCVGVGTYTNLGNRDLRYAVADATTIAERLADPQRGNFVVSVLTESIQTTKAALGEAVERLLNAPDRQAEDLVLLYFSCHGDLNKADNTFCLLPSNATLQANDIFEQTTVIGIPDLARWFSRAKTRNIVLLLDVCHSGGAGITLQHFDPHLEVGPNYFILGAARQGQVSDQSSRLKHGVFTYCLLRSFEQPPAKDGWLTISQIQNFISEEITWFAKDRPIQIQISSMSVNPSLPLLRNPGYPELCPFPPFWNVPFQRNIFFTEQDDLLSQLASMLQHEQKSALTQPQALSGLGGIGKTQLALEYAYRHRQDYHAVLWGRADTREALISTFVTIALLLDLPEKDEKDQMVIVEAVRTWLKDRSTWLLILDNADELALVKEFLPPAFRGHLLFTTRTQVMGGLARKLEVEVMQPEIGALLLLRRSGRLALEEPLEKAPSVERVEAIELAQELGGLPLALDQAGAYIDETQCSFANYLQVYQTHHKELFARRGFQATNYPDSVATTWSLSFQKVEQASPAATELLRFCAYLAPDAIPEEILTKGAQELGDVLAPVAADAFLLNDAIVALRAYSLIARDPQARMLTVHRLVQAILRDSIPAEIQQQWMQRAVHAIVATYPGPDFAYWPTFERLLPHSLTCATWIEQAPLVTLEAFHLLNQAGYYLKERARYREAEHLFQRALAICEQLLGSEHPFTAASLNNLALLYKTQGKHAEAEPLYQRALTISEQELGASHPDTATKLNNLAVLYKKQGKYAEAELLYQRTLAINEQQLGLNHPGTATSLNNLALLYWEQSKHVEAEPLYQRALTIYEQHLGPIHPNVAQCLSNLGTLYYTQGKYGEAEPLLKRALAIREQQLGLNHPDTAQSLNNLANLYYTHGNHSYSEAEPLYQRVVAINEQQLGLNHPDTAQSLNNLANLYRWEGRFDEAEPLFRRALCIREQVLGPTHPHTAQSLNDLADLYREQSKYSEAELLYQRVVAIYEQRLGSNHPDTARIINNLAYFYFTQGKYTEAELLCQRVVAICEQQLGLAHPETAQNLEYLAVLSNLVRLYKRQGKYAEAELLYQRAVAICEKELGPGNLDTAQSLNDLADLYREQSKYSEAEPLYQRALLIREQQLGASHPDTAGSLNKLADLYWKQGRYAEAEPLVKRALAIHEQELGASHPDTALCLSKLAALYVVQDRYKDAEPLYQRAVSAAVASLGMEHPQTQQIMINYLTLLSHIYTGGDLEALLELLAQGKLKNDRDEGTVGTFPK